MEKEVKKYDHNKIHVSFYYESSFIQAGDELKEYRQWINWTMQAIEDFVEIDKDLYINLSLVSDAEIKEINEETRGKNSVTDVLSFPMEDNIRKGEYDDFLPELDVGDILICKSVCEAQAKEFNISFFDEFVHLFIHGFLHTWGYDHELNEQEDKIMRELEEKLIKKVSEFKNK